MGDVIEKERSGKLIEFYDFDTGLVLDAKSGKDFEFYNPEAQKRLAVGDEVIFVTLTTPTGKKIVKQVVKK